MSDRPRWRYDARLANEIERKWQDRWEAQHTFWAPNPEGALSEGFEQVAGRPKYYVLDMFPYPSGAGLHVGHPLGYIGTDTFGRFKRLTGHNVLHAMGYDAFGLPAEQYAVQTGQHPRVTTERNIANMRRQLRALGLAHDPRRSISTTDVPYYRWTQWIFLQIYNAWYDHEAGRARPIDELVPILEADPALRWAELSPRQRRELVDRHRLAYRAEAPVNWCPALGTVLANEEVTPEGRSERGNHPVVRRPLTQWMLRITAYAPRLLDDLDLVDWPEPVKAMQRNWIGRSEGAEIDFPVSGTGEVLTVFTTRPDTLFGATYMVMAPEHPLLDHLVPNEWPDATVAPDLTGIPPSWRGVFGTDVTPAEAVARYREFATQRSDLERQAEGHGKTGVFTGAFARNPATGAEIPIFVADYVLMAYGTGAIMAVPAHDQRDFEFARAFDLPIVGVIRPPEAWFRERGLPPGAPAETWPEAFTGDGVAMHSGTEGVSLDGLGVADAKRAITAWLERTGQGRAAVTYRLRDWLFSRQRYWGEPFPIVYDDDGLPWPLPAEMLPVELPEIEEFEPKVSDDPDALPEPPLARAADWVEVELDLEPPPWAGGPGGRRRFRREVNTMPQWAGSCWYYLRYLDPTNDETFASRSAQRYWMGEGEEGGVDLYVGGVEHAVLHLLYARFWHKVLYDLGHVTTPEPFRRLFNQGYIQAWAYVDERGVYVEASEVTERDGTFWYRGRPVRREYGKMGKSLRNVVTPDEIYRDYGADTLRLYEMFMGPLDASRPWSTRDIVGVHRFLARLWRNVIDEQTGNPRVHDREPDPDTQRVLHRTIATVREDMEALRFNTAIAALFELNNHLTGVVARDGAASRSVVEPFVVMVSPLAPHVAEELWERLGHDRTVAYETFPEPDPRWLRTEEVEIAVQLDGKVRHRMPVPADADEATLERIVRADPRVDRLLAGRQVRKVVVVPGRLVSFVTA